MEKKLFLKNIKKQYKENNKQIRDDSVDGYVVLKNVNKIYGNKVQAVFDFNLKINQNEFIVLVGPSGCGKSTTLRMIAGLEEITSGYLYINHILSNYLDSKDRNIAMVFQNYALYPNLNVYENIAFGLRAKHVPNDIIEQKVFKAAEILNLGPYLDRKPRELSGGQMQRVALGRAIVRASSLFLMDEPLSNLDAKLRVQMRSEIVNIHKSIKATTIYVTHDQTEAMTMADRIVVMNKGAIQQIDTPLNIYNEPSNVFVATFIGNPPMNILKVNLLDNGFNLDNNHITLDKHFFETYEKHINERVRVFEKLNEIADSIKVDTTNIIELIKSTWTNIRKEKEQDKNILEIQKLAENFKNYAKTYYFYKYDEQLFDTLIDLIKENNKKPIHYYLLELSNSLHDIDLLFDGELKKYNSGLIYERKEKTEFNNENKNKNKPIDKGVLNSEFVKQTYNEYKELLKLKEVLVGIRPEDIHFANEDKYKLSETITQKPYFVELLGSEYCAYFDINNSKVIMKIIASNLINKDEEFKFGFDLCKLKLFDPISGERII